MATPAYSLNLDEFRRYAREGNLIPLYREILADYETPVSAFAKIDHGPTAYLLESIEGGEKWARYSFLGSGSPVVIYEDRGDLMIVRGKKKTRIPSRGNPLERLKEHMKEFRPVTVPDLPRFVGGAVGYLSYDMVRTFENLASRPKDHLNLPDFAFLMTDTLLIFDNVSQKIKVVANAHVPSARERDVTRAYREATKRIERMITRLRRPLRRARPHRRRRPITFTSNLSRADFEKMVNRTKEYIRAGDVVQAVLSQRWETNVQAHPLQLYRALRVVNPSPYMYYLRVAGVELVGSSPETLVRCEDGVISVRPIAGTRRRGHTVDEDQQLERRLLADEKERAEHIMLVDLGRNDLGRVCEYGSVKVDELMTVERYSHVMHIVSDVTGTLRADLDGFDLIRATFPAGTVSGAPKVRAMEIIEELEPTRRGCYAGAVGYVSAYGDLDLAITIRTIFLRDGVAYVQAGAGIVYDSVPATEFEECMNKAKAALKAIEIAQLGLDGVP